MGKAVFLDKDGVLVDNSGYPETIPTDEIFPESIDALRRLKDAGYQLYIVSNQSWIGKGRMTEKEVEAVFASIVSQYAEADIKVEGSIYCPHTKEDSCECRKPKTLMLETLLKDHDVDLQQSYLIGDMKSDIEMGERMGLRTILVETGCGQEQKGKCSPDYVCRSILHAAEIICDELQNVG